MACIGLPIVVVQVLFVMYVCTAMRKWLVEVEYGIRPFVFMYVYMVSRCDYGLEWKCWANDQPLEWLNMIICGPMYDKTLVGPW